VAIELPSDLRVPFVADTKKKSPRWGCAAIFTINQI
jgi:hypothetical protein